MASASSSLEFDCLFIALGCSLGTKRVKHFRVICCSLNLEKMRTEALTMMEIAKCLKDYLVDEKKAVTFTYLILTQLHDVTLSDKIKTLFKPFLIECCSAINELDVLTDTDVNNIDCRILMINFFYILARREYKYILDSYCSVSDVHYSKFPQRWMLAEEIFDKGLISDPRRDAAEFCTIAKSFDHQSLFTEYNKKYNISEIAEGGGDVLDNYNTENQRKREALALKVEELKSDAAQNKYPLKFNWPCGLLSILMGIILLAIIGAFIAAVLISRQCQSTIATGSVNGSDSSIITINTNGFTHNTDDITLTLITDNDNDDVVIDVFREDCDKENKTHHLLPPKIQKEIYADNFQREAYNYNGQDYPIYGAKGSQLQYNMSASTPCTVVTNLTLCIGIRIFNNYNLYSAATNPGDMYQPHVDGTIAQSGCLPVGAGGSVCNSTWTYIFDRPQYVWVSLEHQACVKVNGNISGNIVNNTLGSVLPVCSLTPLTVQSKTCTINRTCSGISCWLTTPLQCIYLHKEPNDDDPTTKQYKVSYHTHPPFYGCSFFYYSGAFIGLIVLFAVVCFFCLCCWCCDCCRDCLCKQRHSIKRQRRYIQLKRSKSNGSDASDNSLEDSITSGTPLQSKSRI